VYKRQIQKPGNYQVEWYADQYPSGVYFCKLEASSTNRTAENYTKVRKMLLIK
jgi:hypothetical protein